MNKWLKSAVPVTMAAALLSACGGGGNQTDTPAASASPSSAPSAQPSGQNVTLKMMNGKTSIVDALAKLKTDYERENPGVTLEIETVSSSNYATSLKAKFAANQPPDLFFNAGHRELDVWVDRLEDLSGEPWVNEMIDIAKAPITRGKAVYGMPISFEGYGLLYNKELFAKAGITALPKTLDELEAAAVKLQSAGILPFFVEHADAYNGGWYLTNIAFARQADPDGFQAALSGGKEKIPGNAVFADLLKLVEATVKYGNKNQITADYNTQLSEFGSGKAAMTIGGNWNQLQLMKINPDLKVGLMPMPINNNAEQNDKVFAGVPNYWVISKDSKQKEAAKQFLKWLVGTDTGKSYITKELKFVPAIRNIQATPEDVGSIGADLLKYIEAGKTYSWEWPKYPVGALDELSISFQKYVAGKLDGEGLLKEYQASWDKFSSK